MNQNTTISNKMYNEFKIVLENVKKHKYYSGISSGSSSSENSFSESVKKFAMSIRLPNDEDVKEMIKKILNMIINDGSDDDTVSLVCKSTIGNGVKSQYELLMEALKDMITTMYTKSQVFQDEVKSGNDESIMKLYEEFVVKHEGED